MSQSLPDLHAAPPGGRALSKRQKAAVVVRLLTLGGVDPGISALPRAQQHQLVRDMASLRFVDRETLAETVAEFAAELDAVGLHFPRDITRLLGSLDGTLSQDVVDALLDEEGGDRALLGDGAWSSVAGLEDAALVDLASGETDEVCAVLVSKLPPARAATFLAALPDGRAERIAAAFATTEDASAEAVARIGASLGRDASASPRGAFDRDAAARVADILNTATTALRRAVLGALDAGGTDFAARVRACVFSWENIPDRVDPRDVPKVLRGLAADVVNPALSDEADPGTAFVLGAISARLADQIREEVAEAGAQASDVVEQARAAIVSEVRRLEEAGEISLLASQ